MSTSSKSSSESVIVVFQEDVSDKVIDKHVEEILAQGGVVEEKNLYYKLGGINGFSAIVSEQSLAGLTSLQGSLIKYIESDGPVSIQRK